MNLFLPSVLLCALAGVLFFYRLGAMQRAKKLLRQAKEEARDIAALSLNNPHPVLQLGQSGQLIYSNPSALEIFPTLKSEQGRHFILEGIQEYFHESETVHRDVAVNDKTFQQVITPVKLKGENSYVVYLSDITNIKDKEQELLNANVLAQKLRQQAEHANKARGDFLANMSHELRTPMNGIIGLSEILSEGGLPSEKQEMAEAVHNSAKGLLILLNDILDFSKIEAGELRMEYVSCDIRNILEQMQQLHASFAEKKGLEFAINSKENIPYSLSSDPTRLQQILNNLIGNALKFTEQGSVNVEAVCEPLSDNKTMLHISIVDTGIGIPKDKQVQIFEKFQQAEADTSRKYGGTGLGLAITKELIEILGGVLSIESEQGKGTTFKVSIPCDVLEAEKMEETESQEENNLKLPVRGACDKAARLLIVDDHPVNLLFMRQALKKLGFTNFDEAKSGAEALQYFQKNTYDLILMDCQMPEMDGFETTQKIREYETADNEPAIIAVTADAMKGAAEKCLSAGMDDYISKPVDRRKLEKLLHEWLPEAAEDIDRLEETATGESNVIDWQHFNEFTEGDKEMEAELMKIFIDNLQNDLQLLHTCYTKQDYNGWEEAAHKLYGASSHVGATFLADICAQAETLDLSDPLPIKNTHFAILKESKRVKAALIS